MNIAQLITIVREDYFDDVAQAKLWSDAFMYRSFAEAERQACSRGNLLFDSLPVTLKTDKPTYPLSSKVTQIQRVHYNGVELEHRAVETANRQFPLWRAASGITKAAPFYVAQGRTLTVSPYPDSELDGALGKLYIDCYRLPLESEIDGGYEPEIPEEFHRDLIYWVLHEGYKKQDSDAFNQEKSDYFLMRFAEVFGQAVSAKVRQHQLEQPRSAVIRGIDYVGGLSRGDTEAWDG